MSDKIQQAFDNFLNVVAEEASDGLKKIQAVASPILGQISTAVAAAELANKLGGLDKIFDIFKVVDEPKSAPLPTLEQNTAINALKALGKTEAEIAEVLGLNILTVKMAA